MNECSTLIRSAIICFLQTCCHVDAQERAVTKTDYLRFALLHEGDATRGKQLFANEQKLACSKCHTVDGTAAKAGPDLFAIGDKYGRREIIESVLTPSSTIAHGYESTVIETKAGDSFTGVIKQAANDWIELMGSDGKLVRLETGEIEQRRTTDVSLMPDGLQAGLSTQEFCDLIEYLVTLKQPASSAMVEHGMPSAIQELAKQIALHPFHGDALKFEHPVWFGPIPGESNLFMVVEHESGKIWRFDKSTPEGAKTVFAELGVYQKGTRGLLGIALHPNFRANRKYYFAKQRVENGKFASYIVEREAAADLKTDSGQPAREILKFDMASANHYGGGFEFGPDGYLYIGMGDTGPQEDPHGHGQDSMTLVGKMLRVDVNHDENGKPYAIPKDNPFVNRSEIRPEIWAIGLREPWRSSFDPVTGELWAGDVGQDRYEEVDIIRKGENYGWNVYEGFERFSNRYRKEGAQYVLPVFAYGRKFGVSVTGGFVYRANAQSSFYGVYIFGDYQSRRIWGLAQKNGRLDRIRQIGMSPERVVSFGRDERGELYLVGYEGTIFKLDFDCAVFD